MKIPAIKKLVETQSMENLHQAENSLLNEEVPAIEVIGDDEGEKLTHVLAAIFILNDMNHNNNDFLTSLRKYTGRVRESIS